MALGVGNDAGLDRIVFNNWPSLTVKIEPGDGTGTPEMTRALHRLQSTVYRGFALHKHGTPDARRLTRQERHTLAIRWTITPGSTNLKLDLSPALKAFAKHAGKNTNGRHLVALGLIICSTFAWVNWLSYTADLGKEEKRLQGQRELIALSRDISADCAKQMALLKASWDHSELVRYAAADHIAWRSAFLEITPPAGTITVGEVKLDAPAAKEVAKIAAKTAKTSRKELMKNDSLSQAPSGWITTVTPTRRLEPPMRLGA